MSRMRGMVLTAVALLALSAGPAPADGLDSRDWYRRAEALVRSLVGLAPADDREVIAAPGNIDPKMAHVPPEPHGTMRIIVPPGGVGGRP